MTSMAVVFLRWTWLLGISLLVPVTLPAGGAERYKPLIRQRISAEPFLAKSTCELRSSPFSMAPTLRELSLGTPFKVLHSWQGDDGSYWLYVQIFDGDSQHLINSSKRGWLNAWT